MQKYTNLESQLREKEVVLSQKTVELDILKKEKETLSEKVSSLEKDLESAKVEAIRMPNASDIQAALKNSGFYEGEIDGKIGPATKEAIKKFQESVSLNPDGVIGSKTWEALAKYLKSQK